MKSRENDETKESGALLRKNRSCTYFEARNFACHSGSNLCLGLAEKKARLKYLHRSLWNDAGTWPPGEAGFFFLAGYENRHMDPDPVFSLVGIDFVSHQSTQTRLDRQILSDCSTGFDLADIESALESRAKIIAFNLEILVMAPKQETHLEWWELFEQGAVRVIGASAAGFNVLVGGITTFFWQNLVLNISYTRRLNQQILF